MVIPVLQSLHSADLERPNLPDDPGDCAIAFEAETGPKDQDAAEIFAFTMITPLTLRAEGRYRWGRGLLILPAFSWEIIDDALARILARSSAETWWEVAQKLNRFLDWEYSDFQPGGGG